MALPLTAEQIKRARVHAGEHRLCYRCDSFEKNFDGSCESCGTTDRISHCIREWCPYCKSPELSGRYAERCAERAPQPGEAERRATILAAATLKDMPTAWGTATCTYAILCGGHVKIGKSRNVYKRLAQLQTGAPLPAVILGSVVGDLEREIHRRLAANGVKRTNGEWFEYSDQARAVLSTYRLTPSTER